MEWVEQVGVSHVHSCIDLLDKMTRRISMNKIYKGFFILLFSFILAGCRQSIHEQLQKNNWNITSTSGSSYTADFSETTISFEQGIFQTGMTYTIKDDQLIMTDPKSEEEIFYEIKEAGDEIKLIPVEEKYGILILSIDKNK